VSTSVHDSATTSTVGCALRSLCDDPGTVLRALVGDDLVTVRSRALASGRAWIGIPRSWRWPFADPDMVGELEMSNATCGVHLIGWWSPADLRILDGGRELTVLEMDVAGISLWDGPRRVCTEDAAKIARLLQ
jgi:hypothetical protein